MQVNTPCRMEMQPLLPSDVLIKIASWVQDHATFFSFLAVLDHRGPLTTLWHLSQTYNPADLWPKLRLSRYLLQSASRNQVEAVVKHASVVEVCCVEDIFGLCRLLRPSTTVQWHGIHLPISDADTAPDDDVLVKWSEFPFTRLYLSLSKPESPFFNVLPRCQSLIRLELSGYLDVAAIFDFAASASNLLELEMTCWRHPIVTTSMLQHSIQWLKANPVRRFRFSSWTFDAAVDEVVRDAFYIALFQCPSLQELTLATCTLPNLELAFELPLPTKLRKLKFASCTLAPLTLVRLGTAVRDSSVTALHLDDIYRSANSTSEAYEAAFERLAESVVRSNVVTLALQGCRLGLSNWSRLGPLLQETKSVKSLSLSRNGIGDEQCAKWLAQAIQANATIRKLNLDDNYIRTNGAGMLINCNLHRCVPLEELVLSRNNIHSKEDKAHLNSMARKLGVLSFKVC
ncbi:Aste57867_16167 [Aphanomyces stellatus]|uniref:Aste57867_16167 protein n=1 Tax=Aphanomyces stellatus TaxID=120398 RepID=A0A485L801_9STRA|nr:hypothetical protein As57867_016111 [Aphanomyces stellatus]VFT92945.1 Aste57867_16167 [Aphanomyces stellatus]